MLVKEIMTKEVYAVTTDCTVEKAAALLNEHGVNGLPVVNEDGKVVGMVTEGDLIKRAAEVKKPTYLEILGGIIYFDTPKEILDEFQKAMGKLVGEVMTKDVVTVIEDNTVEEAATILVRKRLKALPVVNKEGSLVGVLARRDILHFLYGEEK